MKNKTLVFTVVIFVATLFSINKLSAQAFPIKLGLYPNNIYVPSIDGVIAKDVYTLDLQVPYGKDIVGPWSIAVRITSPIELQGTTIPSEKIWIRFNRVEGGISLGSVGVNNKTEYNLNHNSPVPLINTTNTVLKNDKEYQFHFDVIVKGGNHLVGLIPWTQYPFGLTFYITVGAQSTVIERGIDFRVNKIEGDTTTPTYGIIVNTAARNGFLELKTMRDYIEGVSQTYKDGLSVTSTTDYSIEVRSLKNNFEAGNNTVPVNAVSLELKDSRKNGGGTIELSENTQTVFNSIATGKQARLFDIRYFTTPNDERLINATPASYQTTLMYTLVPQ